MSRLKRLIHEIHRRSLWQLPGIHLVGAWIAFQGIEALVSGLGLPEWVPGFAVVVTMTDLKASPDFDPLRADPRYHDPLHGIGFPEE